MVALGELERAVMDTVWDATTPLTAYDVRDQLGGAGRPLAVTTVLTVLGRLEKKGLIDSDRSARPHHYRAVASRADHTADLMREVLGDSRDRIAVLERFIGSVSSDEQAALRRILGGG